ncbi:hypothetical protein D3C87_1645430 [compost metagenome]
MNAAPKVPKAASVPSAGSSVGKKTLLKINAAAVPKRKKSKYSISVPMKLAVATFMIEVRLVSEWGCGIDASEG